MAKIFGINGAMTGKLGNTVMAVRNGEQLARQYQPVVFNPNTTAQVANRAKLKLMSQLSAVMAPVIAIPRMGGVSSRNRFVKENFGKTSYATDTATVNLLEVQLTKSVVALPNLSATRNGGNITVNLSYSMREGASRMVYAAFVKQSDKTVRFLSSQVISAPGQDGNFPATFELDSPSLNVVIYGYAVRDNSNAARVAFGNMEVQSAENVANLITSRTLSETDVTLTETKAVESNPGA